MHTGALYNYADDKVTRQKLAEIWLSFGNPEVTHSSRMRFLAPMLLLCNETVLESVVATINESSQREIYRILQRGDNV